MPKRTLALIASLSFLPLAACATSNPSPATEPKAQPAREHAAPTQPFFTGEPRWRPIFQGVDHAELATDTPRYLVVQVLRIDTTADGLELVTTPGNGDKPLDTDGQTTRAFLEAHGLSVAINTHFFGPCCNLTPGEAKDLIGMSIAQGRLVSPNTDQGQRDVLAFGRDDLEENRGLNMRLYLDPPDANTDSTDWLVGVTHAIAGRAIVVSGESRVGHDDSPAGYHPRSLVGMGGDQNTLYMVTIDGRRPGYSTGASLAEAAAIMAFLGATDALNVDGGGSTTMVMRDPDNASQLLNSPSGGFERVVGSNLGLRALPLQPGTTPVGYNSEHHGLRRDHSCSFPELFSF